MKRILSLDGGGVRGIFTLQILARIEALLREERGQPDLVLASVFDLIAGTSTGAIIAAFLSLGKPVADIEKLYVDLGPMMFRHEPWYKQWKFKYRSEAVAGFFKEHFSEGDAQRTPALMGSSRLKTLLLIVRRNANIGSPWPVSNNPASHYNDRQREDCNLDVPLWQLLRASTAAPTFFAPERIDYGQRRFLFVDGGVTPFNNPSLIVMLMATLPPYRIGWPVGREALHVVSVGTGCEHVHLPDKVAEKITLVDQLNFVMPAVLDAVSVEQDTLCRVLGDCMHGAEIDRELDALTEPTLLRPEQQWFTYARYNQVFNVSTAEDAGSGPLDLRLDRVANMPLYQTLGREYAEKNVRMEQLYPRKVVQAA